MLYASIQIDEQEPAVIELSDEGYCEGVDWDEDRVRLIVCQWQKDEVAVHQYYGTDYLALGRARTSWRRSVAGEDGKVIGFYTVAVFRTREEAEGFDKSAHTWVPDPARSGLHEAFFITSS